MTFTQAATLADALAAVEAGAQPIAGGSDLVVAARHGSSPLPPNIVAIDRIDELAQIEAVDGRLRIGATVNHARLMCDPHVVDDFTALADAAALVGSPATRNVGTLGGNIMNGSPAMDTGAPLMVLGARVELASQAGTREIPIADLWEAPRRTTAAVGELCTAVLLPSRSPRSGSAYVRLEYRRAMEIAVVGAAAAVELADDGTIASARVALAAVAPTIMEVDGVAGMSQGRSADESLLDEIAAAASEVAAPISDLRASEGYRRHTVGVMARRAFEAAVRRAQGEHIGVPVNQHLGIGANS